AVGSMEPIDRSVLQSQEAINRHGPVNIARMPAFCMGGKRHVAMASCGRVDGDPFRVVRPNVPGFENLVSPFFIF
ncbi:MAG TPA: hypothetical protein VIK75_08355, partial [Calditerricola sp.]